MSDEQEKPKLLGKFYEEYNHDDNEIIVTISLRGVEVEGKKRVAIGVGAPLSVSKVIREDHQFRAALKHSFLKWLDEVSGVV